MKHWFALWFDIDREAVRRYEELSAIFSEKDNYSHSRELLKEVSPNDRQDNGQKHI